MLFPTTIVGSFPRPDGLIDLPREVAVAKLQAMVAAARILRAEHEARWLAGRVTCIQADA